MIKKNALAVDVDLKKLSRQNSLERMKKFFVSQILDFFKIQQEKEHEFIAEGLKGLKDGKA